MKSLFAFLFCAAMAGSVEAHSPLHTHTKAVPDSVKARCWAHAPYPKKCINNWKDEHTYSHRHAHGHRHNHGHVTVKGHSHGGKPKVTVGVGVRIPIGG